MKETKVKVTMEIVIKHNEKLNPSNIAVGAVRTTLAKDPLVSQIITCEAKPSIKLLPPDFVYLGCSRDDGNAKTIYVGCANFLLMGQELPEFYSWNGRVYRFNQHEGFPPEYASQYCSYFSCHKTDIWPTENVFQLK